MELVYQGKWNEEPKIDVKFYVNRDCPHFCYDCKVKWSWTIFYEAQPVAGGYLGTDIHRCLNCITIFFRNSTEGVRRSGLTALRKLIERNPELGLES